MLSLDHSNFELTPEEFGTYVLNLGPHSGSGVSGLFILYLSHFRSVEVYQAYTSYRCVFLMVLKVFATLVKTLEVSVFISLEEFLVIFEWLGNQSQSH